MNQFSIRDIENLSGIKAHTLRIWEQRYNIINPKRKESKHRFYDSEDLKYLLRIAYLYHNGLKISKLARLTTEEIKQQITAYANNNIAFAVIHELTEAALDFNVYKFESTLSKSIAVSGIEYTVTKILYPYLQRIGLVWLSDIVIPAQEHFSSNIIRQKLIVAIDAIPPVPLTDDNVYLLFTPENEHHEIPLLFLHYLLKQHKKQVIYAGTNVPLNNLEYIVQQKKITHLCFHSITNLTRKSVDSYVKMLSVNFKDKQLVMSGPLVKEVYSKISNLQMLTTLEEKIAFAKQ